MKTTAFTKENQAALKEVYANALVEVWKKDEKMINYCVKKNAYYVPISGGMVTIEKKDIQNTFWFAEGASVNTTIEECYKTMAAFNKAKEENFVRKNLEGINRIISDLKENKVYSRLQYNGETEGNPIRTLEFKYYWDTVREGETELTAQDKKMIIAAYELYKMDFEKKLRSYFKRYGDKIRTRSYWADR